ncbi:hypothetical protein [Hyphomonas atlantica]|uniref:hypothetical protein n=1 Tax=Hyphomonas atlantica TaxID=1280948 RepID=UPI00351932C4
MTSTKDDVGQLIDHRSRLSGWSTHEPFRRDQLLNLDQYVDETVRPNCLRRSSDLNEHPCV